MEGRKRKRPEKERQKFLNHSKQRNKKTLVHISTTWKMAAPPSQFNWRLCNGHCLLFTFLLLCFLFVPFIHPSTAPFLLILSPPFRNCEQFLFVQIRKFCFENATVIYFNFYYKVSSSLSSSDHFEVVKWGCKANAVSNEEVASKGLRAPETRKCKSELICSNA